MRLGIKGQLYAIQAVSLLLFLLIGVISQREAGQIAQERAALYAETSLNQAAQSIEAGLDGVVGAAQSLAYAAPVQRLLLETGDVNQTAAQYREVLSQVRLITNVNPDILDVALLREDGKTYLFGSQLRYPISRFLKEFYGDLQGKDGSFTRILDASLSDGSAWYVYIQPVYCALSGGQYGQRVGACLMLCSAAHILKAMDASQMDNLSLALEGPGGETYLSRGQVTSQTFTKRSYALPGAPWVLALRMGNAASPLAQRQSQTFTLISLVAAAAVIALLILVIHRNFTKPLLQIERQLLDIAACPSDEARIQLAVHNEIASIAGLINHMLRRIQQANQRNMENQKRLLEGELSINRLQLTALQSQINPHFLYNALECIRGMALEHGLKAIADTASNMASLFRYSIKGAPYVRMREEITVTRKYLDIMNLRMDGKFEILFDVPEALLMGFMVKMMLQPLVENAVFHGLEGVAGTGRLRVYARAVDEKTYLMRIEDNGVGMSPEAVRALNEQLAHPAPLQAPAPGKMGIGIQNIDRKIKLLLGSEYGVRVESRLGAGTTVTLKMPYLKDMPSYP